MRFAMTFEDEHFHLPDDVIQRVQAVLALPRQMRELTHVVYHLQRILMADTTTHQAAMARLQDTLNTGFAMLTEHIETEKQQMIELIEAARRGDQEALNRAADAVDAFATGLQDRIATLGTQVDDVIPPPITPVPDPNQPNPNDALSARTADPVRRGPL